MPKRNNWTPRQRIEELYRRELNRLIEKYLQFPDRATLGEINEALVNFSNVSHLIEEHAARAAANMVTGVAWANAKSWREAAARGMRSQEIYQMLHRELAGPVDDRRLELIAENAKLIRSLPMDLRERVAKFVADQQLRGARADTIARELRGKVPGLAKSRIALIARTETAKAATAMTRARSEDMDLNWYKWFTSKDQRVRPSHRFMDDVLVHWDDAPSPEALIGVRSTLGHYHAGNCPNCRCDPLPMVDYREIKWPAKVYRNGRVQRMTLDAFRRMTEGRRIAA